MRLGGEIRPQKANANRFAFETIGGVKRSDAIFKFGGDREDLNDAFEVRDKFSYALSFTSGCRR
jgi:hypothetical protein